MRAHKIVSLCFAILLVTVLFTGVATTLGTAQSTPRTVTSGDPFNNTASVPTTKNSDVVSDKPVQKGTNDSTSPVKASAATAVTKTSSALSATAPATAYVAHTFNVKGRLTAGGAPLAGRSVTLQRSTNDATWVTLTTKTTDATGGYAFSRSESAAGTYYYRITYAGSTTYTSATSNVVRVVVVKMPTKLSLAFSPASPTPNTPVTFSGTLKTSTSTPAPIASATISLLVSPDNAHWSLAPSTSSTTTSTSSAYSFTKSIAARTYYFKVYFAGTTRYKGAYSPVVKVVVHAQTAQTIYYIPQAGYTWVNHGAAGANYNAYASTPGLFHTKANGYPYWGTMGRNDFVYVPAGSATNNQNVASWEIGFHFSGVVSGQRFQKIWDKAYGGFMIELDTAYGASASQLTIYRATTGGSGARWYIPTDTNLRAGHNYYVQISWDTRAGPGHEPYPTVWIGEDGKAPVHQTHWDESGGALGGTGSWYNDAVGSVNLGNTASDAGINTSVKTAWLNGGFYVYRQYNAIVSFSSGGSWKFDKLTWTT